MHFDIQVRIEGRAIVFPCGIVNGLSQSDSSLPEKVLTCPRLPKRLPGAHRGRDHFLGAPSGSRGGMKDDMTISGTYWCASKSISSSESPPEGCTLDLLESQLIWEMSSLISSWLLSLEDSVRFVFLPFDSNAFSMIPPLLTAEEDKA